MTIGSTYAEIVNSEDGACNKIEFEDLKINCFCVK